MEPVFHALDHDVLLRDSYSYWDSVMFILDWFCCFPIYILSKSSLAAEEHFDADLSCFMVYPHKGC